MSRWICVDNICIPSDENDWEELVAFADMVAGQEPIELVRCGECKAHHDANENPAHIMCGYMSDDDFCSYGKREAE